MELHTLRDQVFRERNRDLRIERGHDLRQPFQHGHGKSAMHQVFDHLQADEVAADNDRGAGATVGNPGTNAARVRNGMRLSPVRRSRTTIVRAARSMPMTSVLVCTSILNRSRNISGDAVYDSWNNRFENNRYDLRSNEKPFYWKGRGLTDAEWKAGPGASDTFTR